MITFGNFELPKMFKLNPKTVEMKQLKGIDANTVVHCPTEELANQVLKIAHEAGYKWNCGRPFSDMLVWDIYKEGTCYLITSGEYSPIDYFEKENYKILPAKEFIKLNTMKQLPEKWAIKTDDPEFWKHNDLYNDVRTGHYCHFPEFEFLCSSDEYVHEGYEEITIEQWREAVKPKFPVGRYVKLINNCGMGADNGAIAQVTRSEHAGPRNYNYIDLKWISGHNNQEDGGYIHTLISGKQCFELLPENFNPEDTVDFGGDKVEFKSNATEDSSTGELEGYEAPKDYPFFKVKKGDVCKVTDRPSFSCDHWDYSIDRNFIIDQWKPRYKAKEKKRVTKSSIDVYEDGKLWGSFADKKEAVQRVKEKGKVGCKYTYQEVDYII